MMYTRHKSILLQPALAAVEVIIAIDHNIFLPSTVTCDYNKYIICDFF